MGKESSSSVHSKIKATSQSNGPPCTSLQLCRCDCAIIYQSIRDKWLLNLCAQLQVYRPRLLYLLYKGITMWEGKHFYKYMYIWIYVHTISSFKNLYFLEMISVTVKITLQNSAMYFFQILFTKTLSVKFQKTGVIPNTRQTCYTGIFKSLIIMWQRLSIYYELFIMHQSNKGSQKYLRCTMQRHEQVLQKVNELWLTLYMNI